MLRRVMRQWPDEALRRVADAKGWTAGTYSRDATDKYRCLVGHAADCRFGRTNVYAIGDLNDNGKAIRNFDRLARRLALRAAPNLSRNAMIDAGAAVAGRLCSKAAREILAERAIQRAAEQDRKTRAEMELIVKGGELKLWLM